MDILSLVSGPVSADSPTGADVRYEPAFEELQAEIDKLQSLNAAGSINWEKVVRLSSDILAGKSKDLLVAGYLAVGLIYMRQHDGLSLGTGLMLELMGRYWDDLYPSKDKMRRRLRSIEWWIEKSEIALKQLPSASISQAEMGMLLDNLEQIERFLMKNIDGAPSLMPVRIFVNSLSVKVEASGEETASPEGPVSENKPEAAAAVKAAEPPPVIREKKTVASASDPAGSEDIHSPQDARIILERGLQNLRDGANYLWLQDIADPLLYRLNRISIWMNVEELPEAVKNRTRIPPPDKQVVKMISDMCNNGDARILLKAAEVRIAQYIFWLDLQRFIAEALIRLGSQYQNAHDCVCNETAFFLYRFRGLEDYAFADGMPFADQETKTWIQSIAFDSGAASAMGAVEKTFAGHDEDIITTEIAEARAMIRKGKLLQALPGLQAKLNSTPSSREKVLRRQAITDMLLSVNQLRLALPHLEEIIREIDTYRLEEYEPALAVKGLKLVWLGFESLKDQSFKEKAADALYRIGRLDMAEVVRLDKK